MIIRLLGRGLKFRLVEHLYLISFAISGESRTYQVCTSTKDFPNDGRIYWNIHGN